MPQSAGNGGLPVIKINGYTGLGVAAYVPTLETVIDLEILDKLTNVIRASIIQPPYAKGQYSDIPNSNSGYNGAADFLLLPAASSVPNGFNNLGGASCFGSSNYAQTKTLLWCRLLPGRLEADIATTLESRPSPYAEVNGRQANFITDGGNGPTGTYYVSRKGCNVPRSATFDQLLASSNIALNCNASDATGNAQSLNFALRVGGRHWINLNSSELARIARRLVQSSH